MLFSFPRLAQSKLQGCQSKETWSREEGAGNRLQLHAPKDLPPPSAEDFPPIREGNLGKGPGCGCARSVPLGWDLLGLTGEGIDGCGSPWLGSSRGYLPKIPPARGKRGWWDEQSSLNPRISFSWEANLILHASPTASPWLISTQFCPKAAPRGFRTREGGAMAHPTPPALSFFY